MTLGQEVNKELILNSTKRQLSWANDGRNNQLDTTLTHGTRLFPWKLLNGPSAENLLIFFIKVFRYSGSSSCFWIFDPMCSGVLKTCVSVPRTNECGWNKIILTLFYNFKLVLNQMNHIQLSQFIGFVTARKCWHNFVVAPLTLIV